MKQTAVEQLEKELLKNGYVNKGYYNQDSLNHLQGLFEQAKEMEKQRIIKSRENGISEGYRRTNNFYYDKMVDSEQYYNETYGK